MKAKSRVRNISNLLARSLSSDKSSFALLISILTLILAYRIQLTMDLFTNPVRPFDFNPGLHPVWFMLPYLPCDLALALVCFLLSWLVFRMSSFTKQSRVLPFLKFSEILFSHLVLILLLLAHGVHRRLLFDVQTGLTYAVIMEASSGISLMEVIRLVEIKEVLLLLSPVGIFWLVFLSPLALRIRMVNMAMVLIISLLSISVFAVNERSRQIPAEIRLNPALFLLSDMADHGLFKPTAQTPKITIVNKKESGLQPAGSMYAHSIKPVKFLPEKKAQPWNVVLFIMESVGTRYIFDTDKGHPMPMPFLHGMATEGWNLKKHYTTSNVSTKAVFSLLSGLYDFFNRDNFGLRPDAGVPSITHFLGEGYDRFLVTPSSLSWYFPASFVKNSNLVEIHSYENLNFKIKEEINSLGRYIARDEIQTVDFFIRRLNKAREPFMGVYISFAAHFPYFDYGGDYRIRENDGRLISRYYNNLNLLDRMIKRIFENLKDRELLERTIFVIVGDHGQAFGQHHPNNFMHYRYSYNENLETPAIIYQPALFKSKAFEFPTSHVDILPTLLDAMRIPYNAALLDGESLFHHKMMRKYIFFYGFEESISSLGTDQIKVQYSLKKNKCQAFDLKFDPDEKTPTDCTSYQPQMEALHQFVSYHDSSLVQYNASVREKRDFMGQRHPSLLPSNSSLP